jgi:hypothetical protein
VTGKLEEIQQAHNSLAHLAEDWAHFEITPQAADSVIFVKAAFLKVFGEIPHKA